MMKANVLGIKIHVVSMGKAIHILKSFLKTDELKQVITPNPEIIMKARKDKNLKNIINRADLVVPDGIGVVLANKQIKERVAGIDLIANFFKTGIPLKIYLLGAMPSITEKAALNISGKYPNVEVVGMHHGFFSPFEIDEILQDIEQNSPDLLLVGLGSPKQEEWIFHEKPKAKIAIGCGGAIDVFSGKIKRAPLIFRKLNLEWLYRAIKEPVRFKRLLIIPHFLLLNLFSRRA